jgi:hypothetical protein
VPVFVEACAIHCNVVSCGIVRVFCKVKGIDQTMLRHTRESFKFAEEQKGIDNTNE